MWQELKKFDDNPATASTDIPAVFTIGSIVGPVDVMCHEVARRMRLDTGMLTFFGAKIDVFEHMPLIDFRNAGSLQIVPGDIDTDYGVGPVSEDTFPIEFVITEDAMSLQPVPYGYPTIASMQAYIRAFLANQHTFDVVSNGVTIPLTTYSHPGRTRRTPQVSPAGDRAVWHNRQQWLFEMTSDALSMLNFNIARTTP